MEATKVCKNCKGVFGLDRFYAHKQMSDGYLNTCKDCTKLHAKKHRAENIDKIREYDRQRGRGEKRRLAIVERQNRQKNENKTLYNERRRAYNAKGERIKKNARQKLERAIVAGIIHKPLRCEDCGKECSPHGHHEDYSLPLNVVWVCTVCHGLRHRIK